ncbi:PDR/VanB family oxidoreductase [Virgisporangium aurantiacum]|uniref:Ferredoxin n=1 Tax=Virgisporangium aurantiacum TaxID=175570 RepID=A0A8J3Z959_9ACTN|nr:PDR/VanB family oxidoreductase [Virgisporangium aurantiacum]GIJ57158.1 ferredoxin [Virgisporangium aurantiacum]
MHGTPDEADRRLRVIRRVTGAEGVVVLDLADATGAELPPWTPGAHVDLRLPGGMVRQYSLCGDAADRRVWRIGVLREPDGRGGSAYVHEALRAGVEVDARGPRNHFALVAAPRYVFIAGGIGVTPILPMVAAVGNSRADWELHYGGRSRRSMAFLDQLRADIGGRVTLYPQDEVGLIDLDRILGRPRPDAAVYCCGPEPLLSAVEKHCAAWPADALHVERFTPRPAGPRGSFEVELARSGLTLTVAANQSVLQALEDAGVDVLSSCREGTCGTCETPVLAGAVDHRDSLLTPAEREADDTMFVCVSRAAGPRLVLDL